MNNERCGMKKLLLMFLVSICPLVLLVSCGGGGDTIVLGGYMLLEDNTPVEGVEVVFVWPSWLGDWEAVVQTDETGWYGYYSEGQHPEYRVTITPNDPNYEFSPSTYALSDIREKSIDDLDFVAIPK